MRPWLDDIFDQLAVAHLLAKSNRERLALIIVDNAVEYACKTYVVTYKRLVPTSVKKREWDEIKESFYRVLELVGRHEAKFSSHINMIMSYHDIRNGLYHGGQPVTVKLATVVDYLTEARTVVDLLLNTSESPDEIERRMSVVHAALVGVAGEEVRQSIQFDRVEDTLRLQTVVDVTLSDAILLILSAYPRQFGRPPSQDQLMRSLVHSGKSPGTHQLQNRVYDLRQKGHIKRGSLTLTAKGSKEVARRFTV